MKKIFTVVVFLFLVVFSFSGCGDQETTINGPIPVKVDGAVATLPVGLQKCSYDFECPVWQVCQPWDQASEMLAVRVCTDYCRVQYSAPVKKDTVTGVVEYRFAEDSCKRTSADNPSSAEGLSFSCSEKEKLCVVDPPKKAEPVVPTDPIEPTDPPVKEPKLSKLKCCYSNASEEVLAVAYGQVSWSESTLEDPEAWDRASDRDIDNACFEAYIDMSQVFLGFWVDLTLEAHKGRPSSEILWVGEGEKPSGCWIEGSPMKIGDFVQNFGWEVGDSAE